MGVKHCDVTLCWVTITKKKKWNSQVAEGCTYLNHGCHKLCTKIAVGLAKFSNLPMDVVGSAHNMLFHALLNSSVSLF